MATLTKLPVIKHEGKQWYFDARLRQIRNLENPHDVENLDDFKMEYFIGLAKAAVRIVWKDEGLDAEGRPIGPAYAENAAGDLVENYDWITWKQANDTAERLGVELQDV